MLRWIRTLRVTTLIADDVIRTHPQRFPELINSSVRVVSFPWRQWVRRWVSSILWPIHSLVSTNLFWCYVYFFSFNLLLILKFLFPFDLFIISLFYFLFRLSPKKEHPEVEWRDERGKSRLLCFCLKKLFPFTFSGAVKNAKCNALFSYFPFFNFFNLQLSTIFFFFYPPTFIPQVPFPKKCF